jgi:hypothetical protein
MAEAPELSAFFRVLSAVLLSLSAVTTGWAAYEASVWSGRRNLHQALASREDRLADERLLAANQERLADVTLLEAFVAARLHGDERAAAFYRARFRPELARVVDAWLATLPFEDGRGAVHAFHLPTYVVPAELESREHEARAARELENVRRADAISVSYVLGTVLAAFVGLFAGLSETSRDARMRRTFTILGLVTYAFAAIWVHTRPVEWTGVSFRLPRPEETGPP